MRHDRLNRHPAFLEQGDVILPDRVRAQAIEAPTGVAAKVLDDADVTANGDGRTGVERARRAGIAVARSQAYLL